MRLYDIKGFLISEDICHHGVKGQKWGVRRYQNPDGSLTDAGKKRYTKKIASLYNDPIVKNKRDGLQKAGKVAKDFCENTKLLKEYRRKAMEEELKFYGNSADAETIRKSFDSGEADGLAFVEYCKDKNINYRQIEESVFAARKDYVQYAKQIINKELSGESDSFKNEIEQMIMREVMWAWQVF